MSTIALVPGAGGDATYWYRVAPLLATAGHQVVAVTLPNRDGVGIADHADAIVAAVRDVPEPRGDVVLVAQSMGGFAAPLACDRLPVSLLVYVNAMIPVPGETPGVWWGNTGQPRARRELDLREGRDPDAGFDPMVYFFNEVPGEVVDEVFRRPASEPAGSIFSSTFTSDAQPDVPTKVISARADRFFPVGFQRRVAEQRLGIRPDEIPGSHLVAFSHPAELAAQILSYLGPRG